MAKNGGEVNLKFKKLHEAAQLPTRANPTDSGMDLYAMEDTVLLPGVPTLVKTGLAVELPDSVKLTGLLGICKSGNYAGSWVNSDHIDITFEAQIRPRSGLALKHGIQVLNSPGTVDNSYRGEIGVIMLWGGHAPNVSEFNLYCGYEKEKPSGMRCMWQPFSRSTEAIRHGYAVRRGDRIAQLVISPVVLCGAEWASELGATDRGEAGFGSTGL